MGLIAPFCPRLLFFFPRPRSWVACFVERQGSPHFPLFFSSPRNFHFFRLLKSGLCVFFLITSFLSPWASISLHLPSSNIPWNIFLFTSRAFSSSFERWKRKSYRAGALAILALQTLPREIVFFCFLFQGAAFLFVRLLRHRVP